MISKLHFVCFYGRSIWQYGLWSFLGRYTKLERDGFPKFVNDKWPFYDHFWSFFCQLHRYLSQNWGSDIHLELPYGSWFKIYGIKCKSAKYAKTHKTQKNTTQISFFYKIVKNRKWKYLHFALLNQLWFRHIKHLKTTVSTSVLWKIFV